MKNISVFGSKKQAKMQRLQVPSPSNMGNLNNVRHEDNRHFRKKIRNI
jgi:flagellar basal body rod protein FlgC